MGAGGVESGASGTSANILTEGHPDATESIALVDPASGDYIVFNMDDDPPIVGDMPGFPGTTNVGTVDGHAVQSNPGAGYSYQYDRPTGEYAYRETFVPCFAAGTHIDTPGGPCKVEDLRPGNMVSTRDHGPRPVRMVLKRRVIFTAHDHRDKPIELKPGALGRGVPVRMLVLSPNHRLLVDDGKGREVLVPAKALTDLPGIRQRLGARRVIYIHLVMDLHEIVSAESAAAETYLAGDHAMNAALPGLRRALATLPGPLPTEAARPLFGAAAARRMLATLPAGKCLAPPDKHASLPREQERLRGNAQWVSSTF